MAASPSSDTRLYRWRFGSVEFDEAAFAGGSPLLLSAVLARFFALYTTVNTFVRLSVLRRGEVWKQWPPMTGRQTLL